jgi:hypothetical protein
MVLSFKLYIWAIFNENIDIGLCSCWPPKVELGGGKNSGSRGWVKVAGLWRVEMGLHKLVDG